MLRSMLSFIVKKNSVTNIRWSFVSSSACSQRSCAAAKLGHVMPGFFFELFFKIIRMCSMISSANPGVPILWAKIQAFVSGRHHSLSSTLQDNLRCEIQYSKTANVLSSTSGISISPGPEGVELLSRRPRIYKDSLRRRSLFMATTIASGPTRRFTPSFESN